MRLPAPRTPDSRDAPALRWGVLGTGWIAGVFVDTLRRNTRQQVVAVGSRGPERSTEFAQQHGIGTAHGSYEDLVADPEVDVVYVATPHHTHLPVARLVLGAGKPVLMEKPLALTAAEAAEIADLARARGLFCAEAFWTLFLPRFDVVRQILASGDLGTLHTVLVDHGQAFPPTSRVFRSDLNGGPLLDLGVYAAGVACEVLGEADAVEAMGHPVPAEFVPDGRSAVNAQVGALLRHGLGRQSVLHTSIVSSTAGMATIAGDRATVYLDRDFFMPGDVRLVPAGGGEALTYREPATAHEGLHHQAAAVARHITDGDTEAALRPLDASIATLRVIDAIRDRIGDGSPGEDPR